MKKFFTLLLVACLVAALMIPSVSFAEEEQLDPVRFTIIDEDSAEFGAQSTAVFFAQGSPEAFSVEYAEKEDVKCIKCILDGADPYLCLNLIPDVYQPILGAYSYAVMKVFYEPAEGSAADPKICLRLFDSNGVWTQDNYRPYPAKGEWAAIVFDMTADSPFNEMWPAGSTPYTSDLNICDSRIYFDPTNSAVGEAFYFNELVFFDTLEKAEAFAKAPFADYSAVEAAIASVPADLSAYSASTADAVTKAVNGVQRGLSALDQEEVDAYASRITKAVGALTTEPDPTEIPTAAPTDVPAEASTEAPTAAPTAKAETDKDKKEGGLGTGAIIGIIAAAVVVIAAIVIIVVKKKK